MGIMSVMIGTTDQWIPLKWMVVFWSSRLQWGRIGHPGRRIERKSISLASFMLQGWIAPPALSNLRERGETRAHVLVPQPTSRSR